MSIHWILHKSLHPLTGFLIIFIAYEILKISKRRAMALLLLVGLCKELYDHDPWFFFFFDQLLNLFGGLLCLAVLKSKTFDSFHRLIFQ